MWSHTEIMSAGALVISALGFVVSALSFWRVQKLGKVHGWAEIEATEIPNCFEVTVKLRNPTPYMLKIDALSVPIRKIPIDAKQDFQLAKRAAFQGYTSEGVKANLSSTDLYIKMLTKADIPSNETGGVEALLIRGSLSTAEEATITVFYSSMENKPRYRKEIVKGRVPTQGITIGLS